MNSIKEEERADSAAIEALCHGVRPELWCDGVKTGVRLRCALVEDGDADDVACGTPRDGGLYSTEKGEEAKLLCTAVQFSQMVSANSAWKLLLWTENRWLKEGKLDLVLRDASPHFWGTWKVERKLENCDECLAFSRVFRFDEHAGVLELKSFHAGLSDPDFPDRVTFAKPELCRDRAASRTPTFSPASFICAALLVASIGWLTMRFYLP